MRNDGGLRSGVHDGLSPFIREMRIMEEMRCLNNVMQGGCKFYESECDNLVQATQYSVMNT